MTEGEVNEVQVPDDDVPTWERVLVTVIAISCGLAHVVSFSLFFVSSEGKERISQLWKSDIQTYGADPLAPVYVTVAGKEEISYPTYISVYIIFASVLAVYVYVVGIGPSSLAYTEIKKKLTVFGGFFGKRGRNGPTLVTFTDENGRYQAYIHLFMVRCFTYPIMGLMTAYLTGYQSLSNLYASICVYLGLNIVFFLGGAAFDAIRHYIKIESLIAPKRKRASKNKEPVDERPIPFIPPELRGSPFLIMVPMYMTLLWLLLMIFALIPVVFAHLLGSMPADLILPIWIMTGNLLLSSLNFFIDLLTIILFSLDWGTFQSDPKLLNKKVYISGIALHFAEAASIISSMRLLVLFALRSGANPIIL